MNYKSQKPSKTSKQSLPNNIFRLQSYYYHLPEELIAQEPVADREQARLMVIDRVQGSIRHDVFKNLKNYLPAGAQMIVNNSKVIPARLLGKRISGGVVEVFLLNPLEDGQSYEVLIRPLKKIREGEEIHFGEGITATLKNKEKKIVCFNKKNILIYLKKVGHIPLPPYIKRLDSAKDREDYQTVYAKQPGSVASPTAGLHFTDRLIRELKIEGHQFSELTLHINYGTFKPVECDDIRAHPMHTEFYSIKSAEYDRILNAKKNSQVLVAVGTTSSRVLESVAKSKEFSGSTNIFIYPGYKFQLVNALITNFHLPYSTLLMLVCAFGGYELMMKAYKEAIKEKYRFYSYGDAMLIL